MTILFTQVLDKIIRNNTQVHSQFVFEISKIHLYYTKILIKDSALRGGIWKTYN